jgi:hypothetical protein
MKDDIQFLKELQQELLTQEKDAQASPRFWAIMDYKYQPTTSDHADRVMLFDADACERFSFEDYLDDVLNGEYADEFTDEQKEELREAMKMYSFYEIKEWLKENEVRDIYPIFEMEIPTIAWNTCFFTKEEAKRHLESNRHHYSDKAHTFAMTAWRAPKMERLIKILETFDWDKIEVKE